MNLYAPCQGCKKDIFIKSSASTRSDLEREKGENFLLNCNHCGKNNPVHVNDTRAKISPIIVVGGVIIGVVTTVLLMIFLGAIAVFTLGIPIIIWRQQESSVHAFNSYRTRRSK